jgi:hypothetical protein
MRRWGDGEMGRWGDGEMGRMGDGEVGSGVCDGLLFRRWEHPHRGGIDHPNQLSDNSVVIPV